MEYCSYLYKVALSDCMLADISLNFFLTYLSLFSLCSFSLSYPSNFLDDNMTVLLNFFSCCSPLTLFWFGFWLDTQLDIRLVARRGGVKIPSPIDIALLVGPGGNQFALI